MENIPYWLLCVNIWITAYCVVCRNECRDFRIWDHGKASMYVISGQTVYLFLVQD